MSWFVPARAVAPIALAWSLASCGGGDAAFRPSTGPGGALPNAGGAGMAGSGVATFGSPLTPQGSGRLYARVNSGQLEAYDPPFTSVSVPSVLISLPNFDTKFLGGTDPSAILAVASTGDIALPYQGLLYYFSGPLTTSSQPTVLTSTPATYTGANPVAAIAFDTQNHLWLARASGLIERFPTPLTSSAVPDLSFALGFGLPGTYVPIAITFGPNDTLIVATTGTGKGSTILEYPKPYGLSPTVVFPAKVPLGSTIASDGNGSVYSAAGFYQGPLTTPQTPNGGTNGPPPPAPPIAPTEAVPFNVSVDPSGGLAISPTGDIFTTGTSAIGVYHRPFLATDRAFLRIPCLPRLITGVCVENAVAFGR